MIAWLPLFLVLIIAMNPAAMDAFGKITGTQIISGTMDLQEGLSAEITALGKRDNILMEIKCRWVSGLPQWISYQVVEVGL